MASFLEQLDSLLRGATGADVIDARSAEALRAWARAHERRRGTSRFVGALGLLGGVAVVVGAILLISANWSAISASVKLGGFVLLFAGVHGLGFWLRLAGRPVPRTIEALHFVGGGLFLGGVGLVAQVYHLDARPPNGFLLWFVSLVPLVVLLASGPLALMTVFAFFLWAHNEGAFAGSPLEMGAFASHSAFETAMAVALLGFAPLVVRRAAQVAGVLRASAVLLLFVNVYALGFFRYANYRTWQMTGTAAMPLLALGLAAIALVVSGRDLLRDWPAFRARLLALLGAVLALALAALACEYRWLPPGPDMTLFDFGSTSHFPLRDWLVTAGAWVLWFLLGFWCVAFGARAGRAAYLNVGVLAIGLGIMTRSIDLIGSLAETGGMLLLGGVLLLVTGFVLERWRRHLVRHLGATA